MKQNLRSKVWWPGIDNDVENFCRTCYGCQLVGRPEQPEPMVRTELPTAPWTHLAMNNILGPLPSGDNILIVIDYYSRYFEIAVMKTVTSLNVIVVIHRITSRPIITLYVIFHLYISRSIVCCLHSLALCLCWFLSHQILCSDFSCLKPS